MSEPIVQHPCDYFDYSSDSYTCNAESAVFHVDDGHIVHRCLDHYRIYALTSTVPVYYSYDEAMLELVKSGL